MPGELTMTWWLPLRSMGLAGVRYFPGVVSGVAQLLPLPTNPRVVVAWSQQMNPVWATPLAFVQLTALEKLGMALSRPRKPRDSPISGYVAPFTAWACVFQKP